MICQRGTSHYPIQIVSKFTEGHLLPTASYWESYRTQSACIYLTYCYKTKFGGRSTVVKRVMLMFNIGKIVVNGF